MQLSYKLTIDDPKTHIVKVQISAQRPADKKSLDFFMPSWCPGSYLMREYGRQVRTFKATTGKGERLYHEQMDKGTWRIDWTTMPPKEKNAEFSVEYEVYCHELTVRTSHVDESHAFIHGPSVFMGIVDEKVENPVLELSFPPIWSKVHTGLEEIGELREEFKFQAKDYDQLIDSPLEIGCHESDGFRVGGKDHHLCFYGTSFPHDNNLKQDMKTIVEHISQTLGDIPYEKYVFITHFAPNRYGGFEHSNSCALLFDGRQLSNRKKYVNWLSLVSHEYFHTWNIKRIRPKELGPFDYRNEANTRMLWLAEGLTSFVDELFVYQCGLITLEEYLDMQTQNLKRYFGNPGRYFHSLEDSSFNAWNKLYKRDENTINSSVSYYLKGGLAFWVLNSKFYQKGKSINDLLDLLWKRYKDNPEVGCTKEEVMDIVEKVGGKDIRGDFETMVTTTEDIDFDSAFKDIGLEIIYDSPEKPWLGIRPQFKGDRVYLDSVLLDSPAAKCGLNAGDELIAINNLRVTKESYQTFDKTLMSEKDYRFTVARLDQLLTVDVRTGRAPKEVKEIKVTDEEKASKALGRT